MAKKVLATNCTRRAEFEIKGYTGDPSKMYTEFCGYMSFTEGRPDYKAKLVPHVGTDSRGPICICRIKRCDNNTARTPDGDNRFALNNPE